MAKIKRFPNPGSKIEMLVYIFKVIAPELSKKESFSLYDMSLELIHNKLVSSEGYVGMEAFKRSIRTDSSRDPIYNQSKMYAEVYRSFGWFSSTTSSLNFEITTLGMFVANLTDSLNRPAFKEALIGIADPNNILDKKDGIEMRPYLHFLRTIHYLDNKICKQELIQGPMRYNDTNKEEISKMLKLLTDTRGSYSKLLNNYKEISEKEGISKNTMENYTRLPISSLVYSGWVTKEKSDKLYPRI